MITPTAQEGNGLMKPLYNHLGQRHQEWKEVMDTVILGGRVSRIVMESWVEKEGEIMVAPQALDEHGRQRQRWRQKKFKW